MQKKLLEMKEEMGEMRLSTMTKMTEQMEHDEVVFVADPAGHSEIEEVAVVEE